MTRAAKKAAPSKATRRTATKAVAKGPAPIAIRNTKTAYAAGYLTAIQQATQVLNDARSFGDAIATLQQLNQQIAQRAQVEVVAELAETGVDATGHNIAFENTPIDGPQIRLHPAAPAVAPQFPPEVQAQIAAAEAAMKKAKSAPAKPAARRGRPPRSAK